jgi:sugar phosphate isomerase/epimerase
MPHARAVSAKCYDFGPDGEESTIDFSRMIAIVKAAGYTGYVGIEYEGERLPEREGILAAKALLERLL